MKVQVDTDKVGSWVKGHARWVLPVVMGAMSWLCGQACNANHGNNMEIWYGFASVAFGMGFVVCALNLMGRVYDWL